MRALLACLLLAGLGGHGELDGGSQGQRGCALVGRGAARAAGTMGKGALKGSPEVDLISSRVSRQWSRGSY